MRLGTVWNSLTPLEKEPFYEEAELIKNRHKTEFPGIIIIIIIFIIFYFFIIIVISSSSSSISICHNISLVLSAGKVAMLNKS